MRGRAARRITWMPALLVLVVPGVMFAQEQSRESAALDNTAAAWSFQLAYQAMPDYRDDVLASGETRPEGNKAYAQFRMVAPLKLGGLSVQASSSWNVYVEYATEFATDDWPGAAAKNKYRVNVSYSMPVGG